MFHPNRSSASGKKDVRATVNGWARALNPRPVEVKVVFVIFDNILVEDLDVAP